MTRARIGISSHRVTEQEAIVLVAHNLALAMSLFEATPENTTRLKNLVSELFGDDESRAPAFAFIDAADAYNKQLAKDYP